MKNFFDAMDNLPIVRMLQVFAVVIFVLGIASQVSYFGGVEAYNSPIGTIIVMIRTVIIIAIQYSFNSLVLLGLAEIIKHLKVKNNDQNK